MTLNSLNGTECSTEIIKKINDIIAQKANISLSNLDSAGEQKFTTLAQGISDANDLITALTTVVGTKLSAQVSLQQNGYIKFSNNLYIQWFKGSTANSTFNFPKSFTNVDTFAIITSLVSTDSNFKKYQIGVYNTTKSSAQFRYFDGGDVERNYPFRAVAVGY